MLAYDPENPLYISTCSVIWYVCKGYSSHFVCLSVCLSTSDFVDGSIFTFETGTNVNFKSVKCGTF